MTIAIILIAAAIIIKYLANSENIRYSKSNYKRETHKTHNEVFGDKGSAGEYRVFEVLDKIAGFKKYLLMYTFQKETEKRQKLISYSSMKQEFT